MEIWGRSGQERQEWWGWGLCRKEKEGGWRNLPRERKSQDVEVETMQQDRRAVCDRWTSTRVRWGEAEKHSEGPEEPGPEHGKRQTGRGAQESPFEGEYQIPVCEDRP